LQQIHLPSRSRNKQLIQVGAAKTTGGDLTTRQRQPFEQLPLIGSQRVTQPPPNRAIQSIPSASMHMPSGTASQSSGICTQMLGSPAISPALVSGKASTFSVGESIK